MAGSPAPPRCPACGAEVPCGLALGRERCWCADLPPLRPTGQDLRCLCEPCLRRALAEQGETEPVPST